MPRPRFACLLTVLGFGLSVLAAAPAAAQGHTFFVDPAATDARIDAWTEPHYVAIDPSVPARNQVFVMLPGTGGLPRHYQLITEHAAGLGYHALSLRYPNDEAVNILCSGQADLDCHGALRHEILDGIDRSDLVAVDSVHSIAHRLYALLRHLHATRPDEGWGQFLDADGLIRWERVAVAGHSQGGGHAGYIASVHRVARAVMIASADFSPLLDRSAAWLDADLATPPEAYFGFGHTDDLLVLERRMFDNWTRLGLDAFGPVVKVDTLAAPFAGSHRLLTGIEPRFGGVLSAHGSVAVDLRTPRNPDGTPSLAPVWTYLLTAETTPTATETTLPHDAFRLEAAFPNPTRHTARFRFALPRAEAATLAVYDLLGREVATLRRGTHTAGTHEVTLDVTGWPAGLYLVRLRTAARRATQRLIVSH